jgi:excisionase family DNA binding protein
MERACLREEGEPSRNGGGAVSDLRDVHGADLIAALETLVDERVAAAISNLDNGSKPKWLTISEAAEYARVSESKIARKLLDGALRSTHVGRRRLVLREDLDLA